MYFNDNTIFMLVADMYIDIIDKGKISSQKVKDLKTRIYFKFGKSNNDDLLNVVYIFTQILNKYIQHEISRNVDKQIIMDNCTNALSIINKDFCPININFFLKSLDYSNFSDRYTLDEKKFLIDNMESMIDTNIDLRQIIAFRKYQIETELMFDIINVEKIKLISNELKEKIQLRDEILSLEENRWIENL